MLPRFKAAAVHAAPVFLDKLQTTKKAISLIREAARAGAAVVAFPETFIPAFPVWAALWAPISSMPCLRKAACRARNCSKASASNCPR